MVINGKESKPYDAVGKAIYSPDGTANAYRAKKGEQQFYVVNNKKQKSFKKILYNKSGIEVQQFAEISNSSDRIS